MSLRTLKVYPNPYKRLDAEGRPCCVLPYEPEGDGVNTFDARRFVGATLKVQILEKFPDGDPRQTVQDNAFEFSNEPVTVKDTPYYRQALKRSDILPADAETARKAGVAFVEPAKALERAREAAVIRWEKIEKHEETQEKAPKSLTKHAFGPMADAKKAAEEKKAAEDKKAAEEKKASAQADKGGK